MITPLTGLRSGSVFTVVVEYSGTPVVVTDRDQSVEGWVPTDDGAFVVGEPQGSPGWYPVNDNPRDKATFDDRGAMTLEALREKIGEGPFFTVIRDWATRHRYDNVTTARFIALAEKVSGMDLQHFLRRLAVPAGQADFLVGAVRLVEVGATLKIRHE